MEIDYRRRVHLYLSKDGWTHTNMSPYSPGVFFWPNEKDKTLNGRREALFNNNRKVSFAPFYYLDHRLMFH